MTALRTTRPAESRPRHSIRTAWVVSWAVLGVFGCETALPPPTDPPTGNPPATVGANDPNWLTSRPRLPPPDPERIDYDAQKRELSFYELPGRDHWMVQLPDESVGRPVGPRHRLPEGVDPANVLVYYTRPGAKASASVTVAQIEAVRAAHSSLVRNE